MGLSHQCKWKGKARIVSEFPLDEHRVAGLQRRTVSQVEEHRWGFVALEIKVKVWSEEKSDVLVAEVKGVDDITQGECIEEDD